ncbi:DUF1572 domain-containing protein [Paenibacillaceae bacterium]|nr:DUF1572 domain-containing protein [Paenibacillaceae bacterium]
MSYDFNRAWLSKKFEEIQRRTLKAIAQLTDEQLNWVPDEFSHSIPGLLKHIEGNIQERIVKGMLKKEISSARDREFSNSVMTNAEAQLLIQSSLQTVIDLARNITDEMLEDKQIVRGKERTNLDMLHQCAAHYSEHMGQIFYIAKQCLQDQYQSTSV